MIDVSENKPVKQRSRFAIAAIISFLLGLVILFLERWIPRPIPITVFALLSFVLAPLLCVIWILTSFRRMGIVGKVFGVGSIPLFAVVVFLSIWFLLVVTLPYIYCPPALTADKLTVFNKCIAFAQARDTDKTLFLARGSRVVIDGNFYMLSKGNSFERDRAEKVFTQEDIGQMVGLCRKLFEVKCGVFKRHGDMLLFYSLANPLMPMFAPEWSFLPVSPGVLYSLSGENPNEIKDELIGSHKPFFKIKGNWYMSRRLLLGGPRWDNQTSIPKALIDHSLRVEGIQLDETPAK
jgi:hypothetical protein